MQPTKIGNCNNCGACCYILYPDMKWRICFNYNIHSDHHCKIYSNRPKECREYPRTPMDLERVAKWCSLQFIDEKGRVIDPQMDKSVKLVKA